MGAAAEPTTDKSRTAAGDQHLAYDPAADLERVKAEAQAERLALRGRLVRLNEKLAGLGVRPRVDIGDDGEIVIAGRLPKEIREYAREVIVACGIPQMAVILMDGAGAEQVAAFNALARVGVAQSLSQQDGEGNESTLGAVYFPPLDPEPQPPVEVVEAVENGNGQTPTLLAPPIEHPPAKRGAIQTLRKILHPK